MNITLGISHLLPLRLQYCLIAPDKMIFLTKNSQYFSYFCTKLYAVATHGNRWRFFHPKNAYIFLISSQKHMLWVFIRSTRRLGEALLMSTHNICFCREIRKILCGYPLLSVAMQYSLEVSHWGISNEYLQYMFLCRNKKNIYLIPAFI